jgi:hypothetical protein
VEGRNKEVNMIFAEVKVNDGEEFQYKLFNTSLKQFQKMANRRFVQIGRVTEFPLEYIISLLKAHCNWT